MHVSRRSLLLSTAALPLAACAGSIGWRLVALDAAPAALAPLEAGLLVGTAGPGLRGPSGSIPVTTTTAYGGEAGWVSLATHGERIVGIGAARGGGHGNSRWTVFDGTTAGVTDLDQSFEVFHGWGAGSLVTAVFAADQPVIVGSWQSRVAGNDVAVWLLEGSRWARQESSGTPLASTATSIVQAEAAVGGARVLAVGQAIELSPLRTRPVVWTSVDPRGEWTRIDLPSIGTTTTAQSVTGLNDGWLIAGRSDDQLIAWTISPDLGVTQLRIPPLAASDSVRVAGAPDGRALIVAADGSQVRALVGRDGSWESSTIPGAGVAAAAWEGDPSAITRAGEAASLYRLS